MMNRKFIKIVVFLLSLLFLITGLSACGKNEEDQTIGSVEELNGRDMGCMSGSIFDVLIQEQFPDSDIIYFGSRSELLLGLTQGKIDGFVSDEPVAMMMVKQNDQVTYLDEAVGSVEYGICFSDDSKEIMLEFNEYLSEIITNGHIEELRNKWINPDGAEQKKEERQLDGHNGIIRCVTTPDAAPFSFMSNNEFQGYEVELLTEFCYEYGYEMEISIVSFDALLTSVAMNKYDVAFNGIYITPERAKSVNFCTPTYEGRDVVMIRNGNSAEKKDLITSIKDSFYKNFIEEDRYKLLLSGALTTLIIASFSILFGTLFGLLIFMLSRNSSVFKKVADNVQKLLAKLPAVVLLMLLFYVVFKSSSISALIVSIIGFAFMFANTFYGLLKTGVASVDYGQSEAAMALGYDEIIAFFHIVLPQALKTICDSYISEVISLIKNTSIVGYVSVNDLTRSSDIIRGRTYDALFPLIVVAIIYYLLCTALVALIRIPLKAYIEMKVKYDDKI
ncbi:MAG: transporter substrate-binding domain-containing protein [Erysipelotrichaceae bacterium]|nr:transporter substrate-binding domain-containing protein [Erysipelotrichaceae bacterium]